MSSLLSSSDYSALAANCGLLAEVLARRLSTLRLSDFRVQELKEILRFLKTHPDYRQNAYIVNKPATPISQGKKQQLVDHLKLILQYQQQTLAGMEPSYPPQQAHQQGHAAASSQQQMQQQAALRAQHAAAQAAAAQQRYHNPNDPYNRYSSAASYSSSSAAHPAATASSYQQHPSYAYGNGTASNFTQYASAGSRAVQQPPQYVSNGYPSSAAYSSSAAMPAHVSPAAMQAANKQNEINQLLALPAMSANRSPYEQVVQSLARNLLNQYSHSATQNSSGGAGAYHTTLQFNISPGYLPRLKRLGSSSSSGQEHEVHLRLFSALPPSPDHYPWDKKFRVQVNGHEVPIPEPKKLSKTKKKGLELVRGLDISQYVSASNTVEVSVFRQNYSTDLFRGLVMADLIRIRDTSELMEEQTRLMKEISSKRQATALQRQCVICHSDKDPLRCSRCKGEWYCGPEHQRQHWPLHRETCVAPTPEQDAAREAEERKAAQLAMLGKNGRTKLVMPVKVKNEGGAAGAAAEDSDIEDVEEVDALVSLKCPLSLERYVFPARGKHCSHLTCFNLETFLMFCHQSGIWQCPHCYKPLPWEDIEIDLNMMNILRETDGEVTQIRVHPDGEYDIVRAVPDGESGDGREPRKRKQPSSSPTSNGPVAKTLAVGAGSTPTHASPMQHADGTDAASSAAGGAPPSTSPASHVAATLNQFHLPASSPSSAAAAAPVPVPSAAVHAGVDPAVAAAGTADEPIELD